MMKIDSNENKERVIKVDKLIALLLRRRMFTQYEVVSKFQKETEYCLTDIVEAVKDTYDDIIDLLYEDMEGDEPKISQMIENNDVEEKKDEPEIEVDIKDAKDVITTQLAVLKMILEGDFNKEVRSTAKSQYFKLLQQLQEM